jgi:hypothetical protein
LTVRPVRARLERVSVVVVLGIAVVALGAVVLLFLPTRPGGTISLPGGVQASSVGAGLPLIVVGVVVVALGSGAFPGSDGDDEESSDDTTTAEDERLFRETQTPRGRVYFEEETMYVTALAPTLPMLALAEVEEPWSDVSVSARATWVSGARDSGFALVCRYQGPANFYLLGVLSGGRYNIAKRRDGRLSSLTGGAQEDGRIDDTENDVVATCEGDDPTTLTLSVNGEEIATRQDADGIEDGNVGIRVGSSEARVTYSFDDVTVR